MITINRDRTWSARHDRLMIELGAIIPILNVTFCGVRLHVSARWGADGMEVVVASGARGRVRHLE
ncbi:hypothetical protein ACFVIN_05390 [Streptomyces prasinus]|uniref:hypothetical protein n=1 Tax=Streptomyces prasinus TaxID=67345 RepID=UPI00362EFE40